mgnify:FL=1
MLVAGLSALPAAAEAPSVCTALTLPVARVESAPAPYADFCAREPGACDLDGAPVLPWSGSLAARLVSVNRSVNSEIRFVPDQERGGAEEVWSFPDDGEGDCEDFVLEKRRRLMEGGLPGAALTCTIAFHEEQLFAHALLLVETTAGTLALDNLDDAVLCWQAVPYFFTRREQPDGSWLRFEQPWE